MGAKFIFFRRLVRPGGHHLNGQQDQQTPAAPNDRGNSAFDGNSARVVRALFPPDEGFPR